MIELEDIRAAARRLVGVVHRTAVVTSRALDERTEASVVAKAENLQRGGSFKLRGAYHRISAIPDEQRARGVVAYSSGNHAQAVALAAGLLGTSATIVMPDDAPPAKRAATEAYGGEVVTYDRASDAREEIAGRIAAARSATIVPPYDDPLVMAGQGTAALELLEDVGTLDVLVVPVGGGGLIAGCATAAKGLQPEIEVVGVEPVGADDTRRSLAAGERVRIDARSIADGLLAPIPGQLTFEVNRRRVDRVVTVSDDEIVAAVVFALERLKLLVEPSGAVGLAALLSARVRAPRRRVGVVLSGGNIGVDRLARLVSHRSRPPGRR
ncbi:MAG TPA: threonine/serine dehydratase [Nitriliruptorales bacterium]|nr:threonine/serine dehydratase [Nitriliruptorales bacterium]